MDQESINALYGPIKPSVWQQAQQIKLLICDIDGVFSDGRIYLGNQGEELKCFHTRDGFGVKALLRHGIEVAVITGRNSKIVESRMKNLNVQYIFQGYDNKESAYNELRQKTGVSTNQTAYIGDDVVDLAVMRQVGLSIAVADAHPLVVQHADYQTHICGGYGAVREVCDILLQAQGGIDDFQGTSL
ncbi:MAG: 3-deoxy-D-manno-octulosonate 8-phosphate phosphatase KdsC [Candidatus Celerinatantimonas neptuna]|nr:MAG: 3-deoxy-D-manno-octulosonate 8-phosphate phosphatase KdsC [Candidatus Celerinatantimonas neptuna]